MTCLEPWSNALRLYVSEIGKSGEVINRIQNAAVTMRNNFVRTEIRKVAHACVRNGDIHFENDL